jgi:type II secretory pathway pseudopilin PulG
MPAPVVLRARAGHSLAELVVSIALTALLASIFFGTIANLQKQYRGQRETRTAEEALRTAELILRQILQAAGSDPLATGNALLDPDTLGTGFNNLHIKSDLQQDTLVPDGAFTGDLEDVLVRVVSDTLQVRFKSTGSLQTLAYPIRSLTFQWYDQIGTPLTTKASVISSATGVRFTIAAPVAAGSTTLIVRQTWVFLENRR